MERPVFNDEMALELAKIAVGYLNGDTDDEGELGRAAKVLRRHWRDDGYGLGKEFEDEGYDIDLGICEDLDCLAENGKDILERHIKRWVIHDIVLLNLKPGDIVELATPISGQHYGNIYDLLPETAQYGVRIPGMTGSPTSRYIINCEEVKFVPPAINLNSDLIVQECDATKLNSNS